MRLRASISLIDTSLSLHGTIFIIHFDLIHNVSDRHVHTTKPYGIRPEVSTHKGVAALITFNYRWVYSLGISLSESLIYISPSVSRWLHIQEKFKSADSNLTYMQYDRSEIIFCPRQKPDAKFSSSYTGLTKNIGRLPWYTY